MATSKPSSHSTITFKICWLCEPAFLKVKFVKVINTVRKQNTVENLKHLNFMSNYVTPSIDESVRIPQQAPEKHKL